jgi:hypothetical protein
VGGRALDLPGAREGWQGVAIFGADALDLLRSARCILGVPA